MRVVLACLSVLALPVAAQDQPSGIRLGRPYNVDRPLVAVRPFVGSAVPTEVVDSAHHIVLRDLAFNGRVRVLDPLPEGALAGDIDRRQWNALNVVYLISGEVLPASGGYQIRLTVQDIVYDRALDEDRYLLPVASNPAFRLALHAIADELIRWITQTPGIAATQIAYTRTVSGLPDELVLVDSDGYGARSIAAITGQLYSPTWSPDGMSILYAVSGGEGWELTERVLAAADGQHRLTDPLLATPTYAPQGRKIAVSMWRDDRMQIFEYDLSQQCCAKSLAARGDNISPSYSPDGRRLAFVSTRHGRPGIYMMTADGGEAVLLTPFVYNEPSEYQGPAWSPAGNKIAFHGHWNVRAANYHYQVMIADPDRPQGVVEQITGTGSNEDPSWAPDGRHIVYSGAGDGPTGLYIIDAETKERRLLAVGEKLRMADWSPRLMRAADLVVPPTEVRD